MNGLETSPNDWPGRKPKARLELEGRVIRVAAVEAGVGIGEFLDELCTAAIHAANAGKSPDSLLVDDAIWQELVEARSFERKVEVPLAILGLLVMREESGQQSE